MLLLKRRSPLLNRFRVFSTAQALQKKDGNLQSVFTCVEPGCSSSYDRQWLLTRHVKSVHIGDRPHACAQCHAAFVFPWQLKRHALAHAVERPIVCRQCPATFKYTESLNAHVRAAHMRERKHSCGQCTRTFKERGALARHVSSRHLPEERPRDFVCDGCGDSFRDQSALTRHKTTRPEQHSSQQSIDRQIQVSPSDLLSSELFHRPEPILHQCIQHVTTLEAGRKINLERQIRPSLTASVYDGPLSESSAPPRTFFSTTSARHSTLPIYSYLAPPGSARGDTVAKLLLNLRTFSRNSGEYKLFFCDLNLTRWGPLYRANARALVAFVREPHWEWAQEHLAELDPHSNKLFYLSPVSDREHGGAETSTPDQPHAGSGSSQQTQPVWHAATSCAVAAGKLRPLLTDTGEHLVSGSAPETSAAPAAEDLVRPLEVSVAVLGGLELKYDDDFRWMSVFRISGATLKCPFCEQTRSGPVSLHRHLQSKHPDEVTRCFEDPFKDLDN